MGRVVGFAGTYDFELNFKIKSLSASNSESLGNSPHVRVVPF